MNTAASRLTEDVLSNIHGNLPLMYLYERYCKFYVMFMSYFVLLVSLSNRVCLACVCLFVFVVVDVVIVVLLF